MILGIGTDIIEITRVAKAIDNKNFLDKYFTENEHKLFKNKKTETIAGNFCAKEAISKALGTGFSGFFPIEIEILRNSNGKPIVFLYNKALEIYNNLGANNIFVSISHCKEYATAFAVIESPNL